MGLMNYEREHKVAISVYPFLRREILNENIMSSLELHKRQEKDKKVIVYIHIPFCDSICDFCVYNRIKSDASIMQSYVDALIDEIRVYAKTEYMRSVVIEAIYIGGGTPTALSKEQLANILHTCCDEFNTCEETEVTVEVNPISATKEILSVLERYGVDRVSAGIQTFNDEHRQQIGVRLERNEILEWIEMASGYNFNTIAVDLMYGLPNQSEQEWIKDIELAVVQPIQHLSVYELITFPKTKLWNRIKGGTMSECLGRDKYEMFMDAQDILALNKFQNLIIPEYYKEGHRSIYWDLAFEPYVDTVALGASSFGFVNGYSYQNETSVSEYVHRIKDKGFSVKYISSKATETIMAERELVFSLRKGFINRRSFEEKRHLDTFDSYKKVIERHMQDGLLLKQDNNYILTPKGRYFQEDVAVEYMCSVFKNRSAAYKKLVLGAHRVP